MRIPEDAEIAPEKLTNYLLVSRVADDKSKLLARIGFTQANPQELVTSLRGLAREAEALEDGTNEYGTFYRVDGRLRGANGLVLDIATVWLRRRSDDQFHFVTLKPPRRTPGS